MHYPQLAKDVTEKQLDNDVNYPLIGMPKIDGVRCSFLNTDYPLTKVLKKFPNKKLNERFNNPILRGLEGEIVIKSLPVTDKNLCIETTKSLFTKNNDSEFKIYLFDLFNDSSLQASFNLRFLFLNLRLKEIIQSNFIFKNDFVVVDTFILNNKKEILEKEEELVKLGYEGLILRNPNSLYKQGRSDNRMQLCRKKIFIEEAFLITKINSSFENKNLKQIDNLGNTVRSSHKENKYIKNEVGSFEGILLKDVFHPITNEKLLSKDLEIKVASGALNNEMKEEIYKNKNHYIGKIAKFKMFPTGLKEKPRFPTFSCFCKDFTYE